MNLLESLSNDAPLMEEFRHRLDNGITFRKASRLGVNNKMLAAVITGEPILTRELDIETPVIRPFTEAVIQDFYRPCLLVRNNSFSIAESDEWKNRLEPFRANLEKRIPSVGRIEFRFHPRMSWGGTGFLIGEDIIVTNRHVAAEFAVRKQERFVFVQNEMGKKIESRIDFKEEFNPDTTSRNSLEFEVKEIIFMEEESRPDVAFLRLKKKPADLEPIPILDKSPQKDQIITLIGFPAYDSYRNPLSPTDAERIFGNVYDVKRLSPGRVLVESYDSTIFTHDCTSLGGNSGSAIIDVETGYATGLHFGGVFHRENYAVKPKTLLDYISKKNIFISTYLKPLPVAVPPKNFGQSDTFIEERPLSDYAAKKGYQKDFLGKGFSVALPEIIRDKKDVLFYKNEGKDEAILRYEHFSVVMNMDRRLCFYSAVNINGAQCRKTKRPGWAFDPRIPKKYQIKEECYGNEPMFSRGHMTRREDPAWGETQEAAHIGNADSMHVTNTVPQMQRMNAGPWLELENYALQNAKGDDMMISVFTGPFFTPGDPVKYGVRIPLDFWKVIAFIHEQTGKLCATGYIMSQKEFLMSKEMVYGAFKTYQTTIASIEQKAGISFNGLSKSDPYKGFEVAPVNITHPDQIRFI